MFSKNLPLLLMVIALFSGCASEMGRGSSQSLYSIAGTLEVLKKDIGKDISIGLNQKLFFDLEIDPDHPGEWSLVDYNHRTLLLLSDTPRTQPGFWGVLLEGRAMGAGEVALRFVPYDEGEATKDVIFQVSVHR